MGRRRPLIIFRGLLFLLLSSLAYGSQEGASDLVLLNGDVATLDNRKPAARALAVRGDVIMFVGADGEVQPYIGPSTRVIDLKGALAIPGFIEGHGHFMGIGQARMSLNLMKARNWDAIVALAAEAARKARPGDWILGRGWHQDKWDRKPEPDVEGFPTHESLSRVTPDNPVMLTHASGHAGFVNAKALELSGIAQPTPNPPGGRILKDRHGNPTGMLLETAQGLARRALHEARGKLTREQLEEEAGRQAQFAAQECLMKGVTTFHDAGVSFQTIDFYRKLIDEGKLGLRLWVMVAEGNASLRKRLAEYRILGYGDRRLTVRAVKRSIDGALGPRGAWLLEPYDDLPGSTGLNTTPVGEIAETARLAIELDFQLCVHAIGDRANRETLDLYERTFKAYPDKKNLRWRIEHAQHLHPDDIPRFERLGVIAAMQGVHCTSDAPFVVARLGAKRAEEGAYAWRSLLKSGAVIVNGTDAPVEDVNPIESFAASVSRRLKDGSIFNPGQRMSRIEALKSYTLDAAYAAFEETTRGSLSRGKLADITVLSRNILTIPEDQIPGTEVLYTIVGGKVMYERR